jgi:MFS family permease
MAPVVFGEENPQCRNDAVQKRVAQFTLAGNVVSGILSAITSPKFGALSDRYGRNKIIAFCSLGAFFREIMMIFAARNPDTFPVSLLLVGYALDGLCGSFTALMAIVHSYATDTTSSTNRNSAFAYFHGCLFAG